MHLVFNNRVGIVIIPSGTCTKHLLTQNCLVYTVNIFLKIRMRNYYAIDISESTISDLFPIYYLMLNYSRFMKQLYTLFSCTSKYLISVLYIQIKDKHTPVF